MNTTPTRSGIPQDPELRDRYLRDADQRRTAKRAESARLAAEVPPSYTPKALIWIIAGILTVVLVMFAGFAILGPMLKQTSVSEQALPATTSRLVVDNAAGDVRIRAAEAGEEPRVNASTEWGLRRPDVSVDSSGGTTTLHGQCPTGIFTTCSTDWTIVVPADADVEIDEGAGRLTIEGIGGDLDIHAGVGDVRISETTASSISADLGVGSLWIESVEPPQQVDARVGVGGLSVQLPDDVSYDVDASSGVGESRNDLGSDVLSDRTVSVESGVGSVSVSAS